MLLLSDVRATEAFALFDILHRRENLGLTGTLLVGGVVGLHLGDALLGLVMRHGGETHKGL